jgi:hypothetical protein
MSRHVIGLCLVCVWPKRIGCMPVVPKLVHV